MVTSPEITIAIPALNEERTIIQVLEALTRLSLDMEIIVVNDGSKDQTASLVKTFTKKHPFVFLHSHEVSMGKGAGLRTALARARGRYFAVQDADLEYDPQDIVPCLGIIKQEGLDVLFGSRFLKSNPTRYPLFYWGNKAISFWISFLTGLDITDTYTGRKIFRTEILRRFAINGRGFEIEAELSVKTARLARAKQLKFKETPITYNPRKLEEGKKIRIKDGLIAFIFSLKECMKKL